MMVGLASEINFEISATVRELLIDQERTQKWLAERMFYSQEGISARMTNNRNWTIADLYLVAAALGVQPSELMPDIEL